MAEKIRRVRPRVESLEDRCVPATAFALSNNSLIPFDTNVPASTLNSVAVTGLNTGESLVGIDFRPQNGFLYGLGYNSGAGTVQLYSISYRTGVATGLGASGTFVGANGTTPVLIQGTDFGFDFNPTVDRIRVVNDAGQNFRMNPNNGAFVDGDLGGAAGSVPGLNMDGALNGTVTTADGAAYTNNQQNATVTTLYTLSGASDTLAIQNPPNAGTQSGPVTVRVNGVTLDFAAANGFDVLPGVNVASNNAASTGSGLAALQVGTSTRLYSINLNTAAATLLGTLGNGSAAVQGLAVQGEPVLGRFPAVALNGTNNLLRFNTGTSGTAVSVAVTGLTTGETLVGIDWRPQTGQLFGLGFNASNGTGSASLYRIDPQTGAATLVGTAGGVANGTGTPISLSGANSFGFDFNPTVDRIRVVTDNGLNLRINPNDGTVVGGALDGAINGLPTGSTGVTGTAYTNAFGQSLTGGVTTQYTLDPTSNRLFIQNPPNNGTQTQGVAVTLGGAALDFSSVLGFDIPAGVRVTTSNAQAVGLGYAVLTVGGAPNLYSINLTTGAARLIGPVGTTATLSGLALGDAAAAASGTAASSTVGTFNPANATWTLRNSNSAGPADAGTFAFGAANWIGVVGDWDGDGITTIGVVDPATMTWYLRNSNSAGAPNVTPFQYGAVGWIPVVGDWDGDGIDTVGVFAPNAAFGQPAATWYLRNSNSPGAPDFAPFAYGATGWIPVAGDWDGDGTDTVGVFAPDAQFGQPAATWYLRNSNSAGGPSFTPFAYGTSAWTPVTGDWDGDGVDSVGVFDPAGLFGQAPATWYLRNTNGPGAPDFTPFVFGAGTHQPRPGDWDGSDLGVLAADLGTTLP